MNLIVNLIMNLIVNLVVNLVVNLIVNLACVKVFPHSEKPKSDNANMFFHEKTSKHNPNVIQT